MRIRLKKQPKIKIDSWADACESSSEEEMDAEEEHSCFQKKVIPVKRWPNNTPPLMESYRNPQTGKFENMTKHVYFLLQKNEKEKTVQRSKEWLDKRKNRVTASAFACACGKGYDSRQKGIKKKCGLGPGFTGNNATRHGNLHEERTCELYAERFGETVYEFGLLDSINPGEQVLAGSPDGITASGRLVEFKCPYYRIPEDRVPDHYLFQIQGMMAMFGLEICDFVQRIPETVTESETFIITQIDFDPNFWKKWKPELLLFWKDVLTMRKSLKENAFAALMDDDDSSEEDDEENDKTFYNPFENSGVEPIVVSRVEKCRVEFKEYMDENNDEQTPWAGMRMLLKSLPTKEEYEQMKSDNDICRITGNFD